MTSFPSTQYFKPIIYIFAHIFSSLYFLYLTRQLLTLLESSNTAFSFYSLYTSVTKLINHYIFNNNVVCSLCRLPYKLPPALGSQFTCGGECLVKTCGMSGPSPNRTLSISTRSYTIGL